MKLTEVRNVWRSMGQPIKRGVNIKKMRKFDLIKKIQVTEGNSACFGSNIARVCGQTDCLWFNDCKRTAK